MAIVKIINCKTAKTYAVKAILDYIQNPAKTENGALDTIMIKKARLFL